MKNHFATTINLSETIEIYYKDEFFAQSDNVIELKEQFRGKNLNPVFYFPRCILVGISVRKEKTTSYCPIKGIASYWSYEDTNNCIWSYEEPMKEVSQIKGYYSFYEDKGFEIRRKRIFKPS